MDMGEAHRVSCVEIEFFEINEPIKEVLKPHVEETCTYSTDYLNWKLGALIGCAVSEEKVQAPVIKFWEETLFYAEGVKKTAIYNVDGHMRYFRLDQPMDRIYAIRFYDDQGAEIKLNAPHANNMLAPFEKKNFIRAKSVKVHVPHDAADGSYLAVGIDGEHGKEGAYCGAMVEGLPVGFSERAVSYPVNFWSHLVRNSKSGYTYYLPVTNTVRGKDMEIFVLLETENDISSKAWLCDSPLNSPAVIIE